MINCKSYTPTKVKKDIFSIFLQKWSEELKMKKRENFSKVRK